MSRNKEIVFAMDYLFSTFFSIPDYQLYQEITTFFTRRWNGYIKGDNNIEFSLSVKYNPDEDGEDVVSIFFTSATRDVVIPDNHVIQVGFLDHECGLNMITQDGSTLISERNDGETACKEYVQNVLKIDVKTLYDHSKIIMGFLLKNQKKLKELKILMEDIF